MKFQPLTDSDLDRIFQKYIKNKHRVLCDEYHAHGFECVEFDDETTMIIERLRVEVCLLRDKLKEIEHIAKR
jgi:hypothetical protein